MQSTVTGLAPEFELIVRSAHLEPRERSTSHIRSLLTPSLDWTQVLGLAHRHGVTARVHDLLDDSLLDDSLAGHVPPLVSRTLAHRAAREAERAERLRDALGPLLEALAGQRLDAIPLRCARVGAPAGELIELDLLVRRRDAPAAWAVLMSRGLEPEVSARTERTDAQLRTQGARRFVHPTGYIVSVQWDVADPAVAYGPSLEALWQRTVPAHVAGASCRTLDPADRLVLACVQGTINRWQRLIWVREVADLLAQADAAGREVALARAAGAGARRSFALGTSLAVRLLGAPTTPRLAAVAREPVVEALERAVLNDVAAPRRPLAGPSDIARFHMRTRERVRDQLGYALRRAMMPGPDDAAAWSWPAPLFLLRAALLPCRRVVRAGVQLVRRSRRYRGRQVARFLATPPQVVDRMLLLAGVTADDTLLDLGCGDGAIVIRAAERLGCRGVGIDLDASLIAEARNRAHTAGVQDRVEFHHGDAREMDLSRFTAVCIYLGVIGNPIIRPYLQRGLRPGARVVSFNFDMGDWWADDVLVLDETAWGSNTLYLWHITGSEGDVEAPSDAIASALTPSAAS